MTIIDNIGNRVTVEDIDRQWVQRIGLRLYSGLVWDETEFWYLWDETWVQYVVNRNDIHQIEIHNPMEYEVSQIWPEYRP